MPRLALLVLGAATVLAGCADGGSDPAPSGAGIVLAIQVTAAPGAEPTTYDLECEPAGGDHPQPPQACEVLTEAGPAVLAPVPDDRVCTQVDGGPQAAVVRGVWDGEKVRARFDRSNGCEIERWDALGTTFFAVPLQ